MASERPVRVAVVGAGPAGFFTAEALLKQTSRPFEVDLIERLPTPFGLVRSGVAPDHQKLKSVTKAFEKIAKLPRFRFLANVTLGKDVTAEELATHYDQVVYAVGSATDRHLGIPGEKLTGSHAATEFVGWYNAHPDFCEAHFDLNVERAVVIGVGNVALDVARVLLRDRDELAKTDIFAPALEALRRSPIREVVLVARRGPAQAAFTPVELEDIAELPSIGIQLDPSQLNVTESELVHGDAAARRNVELMRELAAAEPRRGTRTLRIEFLASPIELLGDERVKSIRLERNELVNGKARGTGKFFELETGLVFRSIGYFGEPLPGVPFDPTTGTIPNHDGRVLPRIYAVGWIRRTATGVIGTNKVDAHTVVEKMVEDAPSLPDVPRSGITALLEQRGVRVTTWDDWSKLDRLEVSAGQKLGKVREKFSSVSAMLKALLV